MSTSDSTTQGGQITSVPPRPAFTREQGELIAAAYRNVPTAGYLALDPDSPQGKLPLRGKPDTVVPGRFHSAKSALVTVDEIPAYTAAGYGLGITAGYDEAKDKYLVIVDADNWLDCKAFESWYKLRDPQGNTPVVTMRTPGATDSYTHGGGAHYYVVVDAADMPKLKSAKFDEKYVGGHQDQLGKELRLGWGTKFKASYACMPPTQRVVDGEWRTYHCTADDNGELVVTTAYPGFVKDLVEYKNAKLDGRVADLGQIEQPANGPSFAADVNDRDVARAVDDMLHGNLDADTDTGTYWNAATLIADVVRYNRAVVRWQHVDPTTNLYQQDMWYSALSDDEVARYEAALRVYAPTMMDAAMRALPLPNQLAPAAKAKANATAGASNTDEDEDTDMLDLLLSRASGMAAGSGSDSISKWENSNDETASYDYLFGQLGNYERVVKDADCGCAQYKRIDSTADRSCVAHDRATCDSDNAANQVVMFSKYQDKRYKHVAPRTTGTHGEDSSGNLLLSKFDLLSMAMCSYEKAGRWVDSWCDAVNIAALPGFKGVDSDQDQQTAAQVPAAAPATAAMPAAPAVVSAAPVPPTPPAAPAVPNAPATATATEPADTAAVVSAPVPPTPPTATAVPNAPATAPATANAGAAVVPATMPAATAPAASAAPAVAPAPPTPPTAAAPATPALSLVPPMAEDQAGAPAVANANFNDDEGAQDTAAGIDYYGAQLAQYSDLVEVEGKRVLVRLCEDSDHAEKLDKDKAKRCLALVEFYRDRTGIEPTEQLVFDVARNIATGKITGAGIGETSPFDPKTIADICNATPLTRAVATKAVSRTIPVNPVAAIFNMLLKVACRIHPAVLTPVGPDDDDAGSPLNLYLMLIGASGAGKSYTMKSGWPWKNHKYGFDHNCYADYSLANRGPAVRATKQVEADAHMTSLLPLDQAAVAAAAKTTPHAIEVPNPDPLVQPQPYRIAGVEGVLPEKVAYEWKPDRAGAIGSGESLGVVLGEYTDVEHKDDEGKVEVEQVWGLAERAVYTVLFDEFETFIQKGSSSTSTLVSEMNSAWSGGQLGNVTVTRGDKSIDGRYRVCRVVGAQPALFQRIEQMGKTGALQREVMVAVEYPWGSNDIGFDRYDGELRYPVDVLTTPDNPTGAIRSFTMDPDVFRQAFEERVGDPRGTEDQAAFSHRNLQLIRIACLLTAAHGLTHVTMPLWKLARQLMDYSMRCYYYMRDEGAAEQLRRANKESQLHAYKRAAAAVARDEGVAGAAEKIMEVVQAAGPEGAGRRDFTQKLSGGNYAPYLNDALAMLTSNAQGPAMVVEVPPPPGKRAKRYALAQGATAVG